MPTSGPLLSLLIDAPRRIRDDHQARREAKMKSYETVEECGEA